MCKEICPLRQENKELREANAELANALEETDQILSMMLLLFLTKNSADRIPVKKS